MPLVIGMKSHIKKTLLVGLVLGLAVIVSPAVITAAASSGSGMVLRDANADGYMDVVSDGQVLVSDNKDNSFHAGVEYMIINGSFVPVDSNMPHNTPTLFIFDNQVQSNSHGCVMLDACNLNAAIFESDGHGTMTQKTVFQPLADANLFLQININKIDLDKKTE